MAIHQQHVGNAKIAGLMEDTNMTEYEYGWSLSIFFIAYVMYTYRYILQSS